MTGALKKTGSAFLTPEGGVAVQYLNGTGAPTVKGQTVHITGPGSVGLTAIGVPDCIGVFYHDGVPANAPAYVVISGVSDVFFIGNTTAGNLARTFITAEGGAEVGKALSEVFPVSPFSSDKHFSEIGHVIETRVGAGLAKVNLHFN